MNVHKKCIMEKVKVGIRIKHILYQHKHVVLKDWKEKGILVCNKDRYKSKKKLTINGMEAYTYELRIIKSESEIEEVNMVRKETGYIGLKQSLNNNNHRVIYEQEEDCYQNIAGLEEEPIFMEEPTYGGFIKIRSKNIRVLTRTDGKTDIYP